MLRKGWIIGTMFLFACSGLQSPLSTSTPPRICAESPAAAFENGSAPGSSCDQTDPVERTVGYVAIAAGVVALIVIFIGFYKLARLIGG